MRQRLSGFCCARHTLLPLLFILNAMFSSVNSHAATLQLPQTGQVSCWDINGNFINCTGTGQDGAKQMGSAWPAPRFTDNSNGTTTDNLTGLIWLKNANCFGAQPWSDALISSNGLASGTCGLSDNSTAGQWRLPNVNELESLVDEQNVSPSLPIGHPFSNVQAGYYWSSSSYANGVGYAWGVSLLDGYVSNGTKSSAFYVWPVRGGQ